MVLDFVTILNIASAAGIAILAVPAFSLNIRKKALAGISDIVAARRVGGDKSSLDHIALKLEESAFLRANKWRRIDEICLYIGYVLLLGASVLRIWA